MLYIYFNINPTNRNLLAKDLTREFAENLIQTTPIMVDDTFDCESVMDIITLYCAQKIDRLLKSHGLYFRICLTRKFPKPSSAWNLIIETHRKMSGMDSLVSRQINYSRLECQEILNFDEIIDSINYEKN